MHPRRTLALALTGVMATSGAGWAAGSRMRSPADVAADAAAPEPSLITAAVEKRTLSASVTTRGTVRYGELRTIKLAASALADRGNTLVTRAPEKGAVLAEGDVAMEVSGRPVRMLEGEVPMYRDIRPGDEGADVRQLEEALARLGHPPGAVDGRYDDSTERAVAAWYRAGGYRPQGPTETQRQGRRSAQAAVSAAEDQLAQAQGALAGAGRGGSARELGAAEAEVRTAVRDRQTAQEGLDAARADATTAAALEVSARAEEARLARAGADVDPADLRAAAATTAQAVEAAQRAVRAVPVAARVVEGAVDRVAQAEAALAALRQPGDTGPARAAVTKATRDLATARAQLAELDAEAGVVVAADEVLFLASLPLRVDEAKVARGDDAGKEVMVVSTSRLAIDASVSIPDAKLVKVGDEVQVRSTELGIETVGQVTELADRPGTKGVDAQRVAMEVIPPDAPPELTGASVALTIAVKSTAGEVLAVPLAALSVGSDGTSRVEVATPNSRRTRRVAVDPGLSAEGFVEIRPTGGALGEGDRVVVGAARAAGR